MKGWQATLALVGGLVLGVSLWFGFVWLGSPVTPEGQGALARQAAGRGLGAPAPEALAPSGLSAATSPAAPGNAPPHAFTITQRTDELGALLAASPFVSRGAKGPVLYVAAFRSCPACIALWTREAPGLDRAAIDMRWILYARRDRDAEVRSSPQERAMVAALAHTRDPALLDAWFRDGEAAAPVHGKARDEAEAVESGRALVDRLNDIVAANGQSFAVPALFWREGETWRGYIGYDRATFAEVRAGLGAAPADAAAGAPRP